MEMSQPKIDYSSWNLVDSRDLPDTHNTITMWLKTFPCGRGRPRLKSYHILCNEEKVDYATNERDAIQNFERACKQFS